MTWGSLNGDEKRRLIDAGALGAMGGMQGTAIEAFHDPSTGRESATDDELADFERQANELSRIYEEAKDVAISQLEERSGDFEVGDVVIDAQSGKSGQYVGEDDDHITVDTEAGHVKIPRATAAYVTPEAATTAVNKGDLVSYVGDIDLTGVVKKVTPVDVILEDQQGHSYTIGRNEIKVDREAHAIALDTSIQKATELGGARSTPQSLTKADYFNLLSHKGKDPESFWDETSNTPTSQGLMEVDEYLNRDIDGYKVERTWNGSTFSGHTSPSNQAIAEKAAERAGIIEGFIDELKTKEADLYSGDNTSSKIRLDLTAFIRKKTEGRTDEPQIIKESFSKLDNYEKGRFLRTERDEKNDAIKSDLQGAREAKNALFDGMEVGMYGVYEHNGVPSLIGIKNPQGSNHLVKIHKHGKEAELADARHLKEINITNDQRKALSELASGNGALRRNYKDVLDISTTKKTTAKKPTAKKPTTKKTTKKKATKKKATGAKKADTEADTDTEVDTGIGITIIGDELPDTAPPDGDADGELASAATHATAADVYDAAADIVKEISFKVWFEMANDSRAQAKRGHETDEDLFWTAALLTKTANGRGKVPSLKSAKDVVNGQSVLESALETQAFKDLVKKYPSRPDSTDSTDSTEDESLSAYTGEVTERSLNLIYDLTQGESIGVDHDVHYIIDRLKSVGVNSNRGTAALELLDRIGGLDSLAGVRLVFQRDLESSMPGARAIGKYDYKNRKVTISDKYSTSLSDPAGDMAVVIAHELLHPIFRAASTQTDTELSKYISDLEGVYQSIKEREGFAFRNLDEFFVSFLSDKEFAESLKTRRSPDGFFSSLWEWVVDIVRRLLGQRDLHALTTRATNEILSRYSKIESSINNIHNLGDGEAHSLVPVPQRVSSTEAELLANLIRKIVQKEQPKTKVDLETRTKELFTASWVREGKDLAAANQTFHQRYNAAIAYLSTTEFAKNLPSADIYLGWLGLGTTKKEIRAELMSYRNVGGALTVYNNYAEAVNKTLEEVKEDGNIDALDRFREHSLDIIDSPVIAAGSSFLPQQSAYEEFQNFLKKEGVNPGIREQATWYITEYLQDRYLEAIGDPHKLALGLLQDGKDMPVLEDDWMGSGDKPSTGNANIDKRLYEEGNRQVEEFNRGGVQLSTSERAHMLYRINDEILLDTISSLADYGAKKFNYGDDVSGKRINMEDVSAAVVYEEIVIHEEKTRLSDIAALIATQSNRTASQIEADIIENTGERRRKRTAPDTTDSQAKLLDLKTRKPSLEADLEEARKAVEEADDDDRTNRSDTVLRLLNELQTLEDDQRDLEAAIALDTNLKAYADLSHGSRKFLEVGTKVVVPKEMGAALDLQTSDRRANAARERIKELEDMKGGLLTDESIRASIKTQRKIIEQEESGRRGRLSSQETQEALGKTFGGYLMGATERKMIEGDIKPDQIVEAVPHPISELRAPMPEAVVVDLLSGTLYEATQNTLGKSQGLYEQDGGGIKDTKNSQRTYYQFRNKHTGMVALTGVWASTKQELRVAIKSEKVPVLSAKGEKGLQGAFYLGLRDFNGKQTVRYLVPTTGAASYEVLDLAAGHEYIEPTPGGRMRLRTHSRVNVTPKENTKTKADIDFYGMVYNHDLGRYIYATPLAKKRTLQKDINELSYQGREGKKLIFKDRDGEIHKYNSSQFVEDGKAATVVEREFPKTADNFEMSHTMYLEPSTLVGGSSGHASGRKVADFIINQEDWVFTGESVQFASPPMDVEGLPKAFYFASTGAYDSAKDRAMTTARSAPVGKSRHEKATVMMAGVENRWRVEG